MEEKKLNQEEIKVETITAEEEVNKDESVEEVENKTTEEIIVKDNSQEEKQEVEPEYDGPSVTVSTRYDYKTLKYFNMFNMKYKTHYAFLYIGLAVLCLAYTIYYIITTTIPTLQSTEDAGIYPYLVPVIFALFVVYSIYAFFNVEKTLDRQLTTHFNTTEVITVVQAKVTLEGVTISTNKNEGETKYDWLFITKVYEVKEYYYLCAGKVTIIISKDPNCIIDGDYEKLAEIIQEKVTEGAKKYKFIDKEIVKKPITYVHRQDMEDYKAATEVTEITETPETVEEDNKESIEATVVVEENNQEENQESK